MFKKAREQVKSWWSSESTNKKQSITQTKQEPVEEDSLLPEVQLPDPAIIEEIKQSEAEVSEASEVQDKHEIKEEEGDSADVDSTHTRRQTSAAPVTVSCHAHVPKHPHASQPAWVVLSQRQDWSGTRPLRE